MARRTIFDSLYLTPEELEALCVKRQERYNKIQENETLYEEIQTDDADLIVVAYGTIARIAMSRSGGGKKERLRKVGLIRPITLWPFPTKAFERLAETAKCSLSVEMSLGQMVEDVRLAVNGRKPVYYYGRTGGMVPEQDAIVYRD